MLSIVFAAGVRGSLFLMIAPSVQILLQGLATELSGTVKFRVRIVLIIAARVVLLLVGKIITAPIANLPARPDLKHPV